MLILGIESSCDDTSVALLDCKNNGCVVLSEKTASQITIHKKYGGVVPEIAGRMHAEKITPLMEEVLKDRQRPDVIAVTAGPGLITGLIVGVEAARALSYAWGIPLVAVNHIEGHIHSVELNNESAQIPAFAGMTKPIEYPALALVVSGGHTELIFIAKKGKYKKIGATKDDAAGECFDKVAKLLGLSYPGGPRISKLAETGDSQAIIFPRPMLHEKNFNFSFSGLKTSALYWLRDHKLAATHSNIFYKTAAWLGQSPDTSITINDFCASFEQAIIDTLINKTIKAAEQFKPNTIILAGGVAANKKLRKTLKIEITDRFPKTDIRHPKVDYCMDNAAMIAIAGYHQANRKDFTNWTDIKANPNWEIK